MTTLANREESEEGDLTEMLEDLLAVIMTASDPSDPSRSLHHPFRLLPSQKVRFIYESLDFLREIFLNCIKISTVDSNRN